MLAYPKALEIITLYNYFGLIAIVSDCFIVTYTPPEARTPVPVLLVHRPHNGLVHARIGTSGLVETYKVEFFIKHRTRRDAQCAICDVRVQQHTARLFVPCYFAHALPCFSFFFKSQKNIENLFSAPSGGADPLRELLHGKARKYTLFSEEIKNNFLAHFMQPKL